MSVRSPTRRRIRAGVRAVEVGKVVAGWKKHFRSLGVVRRDLDEIAQYIDSDRLRAQRGQ